MRRLTVSLATLGLTALGLALPATAHAGPGCNAEWNSHGRDGDVRAWDCFDCGGELLGVTPGDDPEWGDSYGPFPSRREPRRVRHEQRLRRRQRRRGLLLLRPLQRQGVRLPSSRARVRGQPRPEPLTDGARMYQSIESHAWVAASACAPGSFIS